MTNIKPQTKVMLLVNFVVVVMVAGAFVGVNQSSKITGMSITDITGMLTTAQNQFISDRGLVLNPDGTSYSEPWYDPVAPNGVFVMQDDGTVFYSGWDGGYLGSVVPPRTFDPTNSDHQVNLVGTWDTSRNTPRDNGWTYDWYGTNLYFPPGTEVIQVNDELDDDLYYRLPNGQTYRISDGENPDSAVSLGAQASTESFATSVLSQARGDWVPDAVAVVTPDANHLGKEGTYVDPSPYGSTYLATQLGAHLGTAPSNEAWTFETGDGGGTVTIPPGAYAIEVNVDGANDLYVMDTNAGTTMYYPGGSTAAGQTVDSLAMNTNPTDLVNYVVGQASSDIAAGDFADDDIRGVRQDYQDGAWTDPYVAIVTESDAMIRSHILGEVGALAEPAAAPVTATDISADIAALGPPGEQIGQDDSGQDIFQKPDNTYAYADGSPAQEPSRDETGEPLEGTAGDSARAMDATMGTLPTDQVPVEPAPGEEPEGILMWDDVSEQWVPVTPEEPAGAAETLYQMYETDSGYVAVPVGSAPPSDDAILLSETYTEAQLAWQPGVEIRTGVTDTAGPDYSDWPADGLLDEVGSDDPSYSDAAYDQLVQNAWGGDRASLAALGTLAEDSDDAYDDLADLEEFGSPAIALQAETILDILDAPPPAAQAEAARDAALATDDPEDARAAADDAYTALAAAEAAHKANPGSTELQAAFETATIAAEEADEQATWLENGFTSYDISQWEAEGIDVDIALAILASGAAMVGDEQSTTPWEYLPEYLDTLSQAELDALLTDSDTSPAVHNTADYEKRGRRMEATAWAAHNILNPGAGAQAASAWMQQEWGWDVGMDREELPDFLSYSLEGYETAFCDDERSDAFIQDYPGHYQGGIAPGLTDIYYITAEKTSFGGEGIDWPGECDLDGDGARWFPKDENEPLGYLYKISWHVSSPITAAEASALGSDGCTDMGLDVYCNLPYKIMVKGKSCDMSTGYINHAWSMPVESAAFLVAPGGVSTYSLTIYDIFLYEYVCLDFSHVLYGFFEYDGSNYQWPAGCAQLVVESVMSYPTNFQWQPGQTYTGSGGSTTTGTTVSGGQGTPTSSSSGGRWCPPIC